MKRIVSTRRFLNLLLFTLISVALAAQSDIRSYDGSDNNLSNPNWGKVGEPLKRIASIGFTDKISTPAGASRMNPRAISNAMFAQDEILPDPLQLSDYTWVFGQFIDHDISFTESDAREPAFVTVPEGDKHFTPGSLIFMSRSVAMHDTGTSVDNPRQNPNNVTAFIDGSMVYGSSFERAEWLRTKEDGKLKVSRGNLLPWNTTTGEFNDPELRSTLDSEAYGMDNDASSSTKLFVAGDRRANENPLLISFHTLFVREHNRICDELKEQDASLSDEELYQKARKMVGGIIQNIVYKEWLPAQGVSLPEYQGYNPNMDPSIFNVFSAAAFRLGHTLINSTILRMDNNGNEISRGNSTLRESFFQPTEVRLAGGIDPFLIGMATQMQQELDCKIVDDVRNFLFGTPDQGGLDLAAININRGRERGLPDYNTVREDFGLPRVNTFMDITNDPETARILDQISGGDINNIDPWVGMLAEYHMPNALFGELIMTIIERQFQLLRGGDRFYFENDPGLSHDEKEIIRNTRFRDVIMNNTDIEIMQENVFVAMPHNEIPNGPALEENNLASIVYPNPTNSEFTIKFYLDEEKETTFRIYAPNGSLVTSRTQVYPAGQNFIDYDLRESLAKGLYHILIESGFEYTVHKLIKE